MRWWHLALGYVAAAYVADVVVRPAVVARQARAAAKARSKPLLDVGAGTSSSSLRVALLGPPAHGDVNCDVAAQTVCAVGTPGVCHCDVHHLPWPDKFFGAALATHVLEHVDNPAAALAELRRVADEVFVVVPAWWAPHTWLHPGHKWFVSSEGGVHPLWQSRAGR